MSASMYGRICLGVIAIICLPMLIRIYASKKDNKDVATVELVEQDGYWVDEETGDKWQLLTHCKDGSFRCECVSCKRCRDCGENTNNLKE